MPDLPSLAVFIPTRGRKERCEELLKSFQETTDNADLLFVIDEDDQETYEGMDWGRAECAVFAPKGTLSDIINHTAVSLADDYDALMFVADDHLFRTPHWDTIMLRELVSMGGTGFVYPDDKRRSDVPEIVMISSDIVKELGFFSEPSLGHFYIDNAWAELGKRLGLIRYVPEAVIEHRHYSICRDVEHDETYRRAEDNHGDADLAVFRQWRVQALPYQASLLRRKFNPDIKWLLAKI